MARHAATKVDANAAPHPLPLQPRTKRAGSGSVTVNWAGTERVTFS
jgi:hypothetical protein